MDDKDFLATRFDEHRPHLRAVAYRMLGSRAEADDAVQEAWLRLNRSEADEIENLGGWLTTVVARVALNMLRSRAAKREEPLEDVRFPEPLIDREDAVDPEHQALLADSVGLALLVVLETLSPAEREIATTSWPCSVRISTSGVPRRPVAPVTAIFMNESAPCHIKWIASVNGLTPRKRGT